ncbi:MAG: GNAT family N-acetyltransferase [Pigmentiphaga sp.]
MPSDLSDIHHETCAEGGRYRLHLADTAEPAILEYTQDPAHPQQIVAKHTRVPDAMRGHGVALRLVQRLVADARANGWRVEPRCSYVRAQAERHPEWADVFA